MHSYVGEQVPSIWHTAKTFVWHPEHLAPVSLSGFATIYLGPITSSFSKSQFPLLRSEDLGLSSLMSLSFLERKSYIDNLRSHGIFH